MSCCEGGSGGRHGLGRLAPNPAGGCCCCENEGGLRRRYTTRQEIKENLQRYREELVKELAGVDERVAEL